MAAPDTPTSSGAWGPAKGVGLAAPAYMCGALHPVYQNEMSQSGCRSFKVDRSGEVTLFSGTADVGQGSSHMLAALCAERLGVQPEDVRVIEGDTSLTPVTSAAYSSRVTFMAGNAVSRPPTRYARSSSPPSPTRSRCAPGSLRRRDARIAHRGSPARGVVVRRRGVAGRGEVRAHRRGRRLQAAQGRQPVQAPVGVGPRPPTRSRRGSPRSSVDARPASSPSTASGSPSTRAGHQPHVVEADREGCVYMGVGEAMIEEQAYRRAG